MCTFHVEHLHPIKPPPGFRRTLMRALQTGGYCLNRQFGLNTKANWSAVEAKTNEGAVEANRQLAVNPRAVVNYASVEAAAFHSSEAFPVTW